MNPHEMAADRLRLELCLATTEVAILALESQWPHTFGHSDASAATYIHACQCAKALRDLRRSLGLDLSAVLAADLAQSAHRVPP